MKLNFVTKIINYVRSTINIKLCMYECVRIEKWKIELYKLKSIFYRMIVTFKRGMENLNWSNNASRY